MKKILKLSLVCAVLFTGLSTYAINGDEGFALHVLKGNGKEVTFALNQTKRAYISIYGKDGSLIYSENAAGKNGILRTFSFEEFPEGTYYLEVEDSEKKVRHEIIVTDEATILSSKAVSSAYKTSSEKNTSVAIR
jgi:uncharacterized protein (UPF0128 family)